MHRTTRISDDKAIQAAHLVATPRIGGVAVVTALIAGVLLFAPSGLERLFAIFMLSVIPVAAAGLAEDLGVRISPRGRLVAAAASSLVVIGLLQIWLTKSHMPGLDLLLHLAPMAILFTVFAVTGICHAVNLIDGVNGLAAVTAMLIAMGLGAICLQAGLDNLAFMVLLIVPAVLGFFIFNFPAGKIFLGDGGAYTLGHVLGWFAILVIQASTEVTPWAVLLVFFWPVADTALAIYRRKHAGRPTHQPDRLHFHQLIMRALELVIMGRQQRAISNPLTTLILTPFIAAPVLCGIVLWDRPAEACAAFVLFGVVFMMTYATGLAFAKRRGQPLISRISLTPETAGLHHL
ncbi:MraY family glycosyltransferase [Phaeovulum sp.]|uniref:MraY family glycosyltransferase n=1 Tax=Phaeovulum sp. TaxID=2934796 RepID=UPI0039E5555C